MLNPYDDVTLASIWEEGRQAGIAEQMSKKPYIEDQDILLQLAPPASAIDAMKWAGVVPDEPPFVVQDKKVEDYLSVQYMSGDGWKPYYEPDTLRKNQKRQGMGMTDLVSKLEHLRAGGRQYRELRMNHFVKTAVTRTILHLKDGEISSLYGEENQ